MITFPGVPAVGIETIDPAVTSAEILHARGRQISHLLREIYTFYEEDLGLKHIDQDPRPHPGDHEMTEWRVSRLRESGPSQQDKLQYTVAVELDHTGQPSDSDDALAGLLILQRHNPLTTEIVEWDVAKLHRQRGLGRQLGAVGLASVPNKSQLILDVAKPNLIARTMYTRYGFLYTGRASQQHGIFAVRHLQMMAPAATVKRKLTPSHRQQHN